MIGPSLRRGSRTVHYLRQRWSSSFYRVGEREAFLIERLDGKRTVEQVSNEYLEHFDRRLIEANWQSLLGMLGSRGLLAGTEPISAPANEAPPPSQTGIKRLLYYRLPLARMPERIARLSPHLSIFFMPPVFIALSLLSLVACIYALSQWQSLSTAWSSTPDAPLAIAVAFIVLWFSILAHELAHGVACARYGGRAQEFGLMWRFPLLVPYCKVDDVVLFARRRQRVATAYAGTFVSLLAPVPFAAVWIFGPSQGRLHHIAGAVLLVSVAGALINLLPIFQLDGYAMLNHALGMVDLRSDAYDFGGRWLRRQVRFRDYPPICRLAYTGYGALTTLLVGAPIVVLAVTVARQLRLSEPYVIAIGAGAAGVSAAAIAGIALIAGKYSRSSRSSLEGVL
jgi:putative peptide zinc metalloprotease protein